MAVSLSYVLTTRNKLPYLRRVLPDLIAAKGPDEEILVADGASTDGTAEYLKELADQGKIDFFVSEPDKGEGHGYNKLLMQARGELIKVITDDDVFFYPGIRTCKAFMLEHREVDLLSTEGIKRRKSGSLYPQGALSYRAAFSVWLRDRTPFDSCGLGLMLRRSSLPLLGLFSTDVVRTDAEYMLRTTAGKATLAWYTLECYARVLNPSSNTTTQSERYYRDTERLEALYFNTRRPAWLTLARNTKRLLTSWLRSTPKSEESVLTLDEWNEIYTSSIDWLTKNGAAHAGEFLWQK